ncbi:PEP-CTERM sorting domain-containing protein [Pontiellaceae bacterium B12219]|nr:PEP-CTERM sorting domain-containing protein [Pontiellaceae bacterium B12219]
MSTRIKVRAVAAGVALAALPFSAMAQTTVTWDGAGDGTTYEDGANWGGTAPADDLTGNIAQLTGGTVDLSTTRQVSGLDYSTGSTLSGIGSLEIGTGGIYVGGNSYLNTVGLVLNQANTTVTLGGGRLSLGPDNVASGTGALTVTGNNTLYIDRTASANTFAGGTTITGGATVSAKRGDTLGTGAVTFDNGTWSDNNAGYSIANDIIVNDGGGTLQFDGNTSSSFSGTGALTIIGKGNEKSFTSTGNTISGGITFDNTFFRTYGSDSYGTGDITLKNGAILKNYKNNLTFDNNFVMGDGGGQLQIGWTKSLTLNGIISGAGSLTVMDDSATINLNNTGNTFSGGLTIIDDTVNAKGYVNEEGVITGNSVGLGDITFDGGNLVATESNDLGSRGIHLEAGGGSIRLYNNRVVAHDGTIDGVGALTVGNDGGTLRLKGANTYSGGTEIQGKVWVESGALGTGDVTLNNVEGTDRGHLQNYNNGADTLENNIIIHANGGRLQAGWNTSFTLNGVVSGSGELTIVGDSGTVVLANEANTYSGAINLQDTTSRLSLASLGAGSTINGDAAATLTLLGNISLDNINGFAGLTTVSSGGSIAGSGSLAGDLALDAGAAFIFSETDTLMVAGTVTVDSTFGIDDLIGLSSSTAEGTYTLIGTTSTFDYIENFGAENAYDLGDGKSAYFENGSLQVTVIPEPAVLGLLVTFGGGLLFLRRRFKA